MSYYNYPPPPGPPPGYQLYPNMSSAATGPGPQPQYAPPAPGHPGYKPDEQYSGPPSLNEKYTFEQQFALPNPRFNDKWAAILFILDILGFAAVSALAMRGYATTRNVQGSGIYDDKRNDFGLSTNTIILFMFVLVIGLIISWAYLLLARTATKAMIYITAVLSILIGLGTAVYYFSKRYYSGAIVFLVFALFYAFAFWTWRPRIPFAVLMLQTAVDVARSYGHVFLVSFIGGLVAIGFGAWFSITFVAVYSRWSPSPSNPACAQGGCSQAKVIGLLVFVVFSGYWITEFIKNAMHTTVSGVYGSWYFSARTPGGPPRNPTLGAFKRTMTYSFGSVAFGSLVVSLIQLLRQAASLAQTDAAAEGNIIMYIAFCCLQAILALTEWLVQYFNHYAYSLIALYGKPYIKAAKDTWRMIKDRGIDAIVNDSLIFPILSMGAILVGYLSALFAYLYLTFTKPTYNKGGDYTPLILAFAFLIGLQTANVVLNPIKSGVATIFVAMGWDPQVMLRDRPELWEKMVRVYPPVQHAVGTALV